MTKIKHYFVKNYFSRKFPLDYRLYMIFFLESYFLSILSATTNTLLGKGVLGITVQWLYIALCTVVLFISAEWRMKLSRYMLLFTSYVYIPFLYFQTAGYDGTAMLFCYLSVVLIAVLFSEKKRMVAVAVNILIMLGCILAQFYNPALVIPHASQVDKVVDLIVAFVLSMTGLAIMVVYVLSAFNREQVRIQLLLEKIRRSNERLEKLTNIDPLTGAYNRRYFEEHLSKELEATEENGKNISVLMIDVDNFKKINDTYGHGMGDEVLVTLTKEVKRVLRSYDIFSRIGGDEFIATLHDMSREQSMAIAERIRSAVAEKSFARKRNITVSIGVAEKVAGDTTESLMGRADENLYKAKEQGKNSVF